MINEKITLVINMKIKRLRDIREEKEMTQEDVANILKVNRSTYTGWETGRDTIPLVRLNVICRCFNVSFDYIMGLSNEDKHYEEITINAKIIGKNLKKFRKDRDLPQKELFNYLNTTSSTWSAYETGKVIIKTDFLYTICQKYNLSVDEMLSSKD